MIKMEMQLLKRVILTLKLEKEQLLRRKLRRIKMGMYIIYLQFYLGNKNQDIIEETRIDENGNVITVKKKVFRDKDGREVIEEEIIGADGKKYAVRTKTYKDSEGNEVTEEERIDEFGIIMSINIGIFNRIKKGNKIIVRKIKDKDGKEIIEEIKVDKFGKKTGFK